MAVTRIETDARGVANLTLARPEKHNAMDAAMIAELAAAAERLGADPAVRVVVLRADGRTFCAGGDLGWMQDQMAADRATRMAEATKLAAMLGVLDRLPKPLIGAVSGNAFGGGVGMISVCDVAVAVDSAKFALTETKLGIIPATIGPYVVARMGGARARQVFMSGRMFGAEEAVRLGLIARAVPQDAFEDAVEAEITPYLACAPGAVADAKRLVARLSAPADAEQVAMSIEALADRWETEEAKAGIAAFFAKERAPWA
ncbi:crotonase/enoyl-CoA hydratase family protein [Rhodobacterales bacterium HKCCE3408]|nr:crotonase/enoyl-CoA hydratase family protein [Rhodobacterales bacterium HKCCE3408]